jgi:fluoroacetyl-CoA thioesterase
MRNTLRTGLEHEFKFIVPESKTVPNLFRESPEFQIMPEVFATGFMVGLVEWTCIQLVNPHIDWPDEQTVGIHVNLSHTAPTPPGMEVRVKVVLRELNGRRLLYDVEAHDGMDEICRGTHERFIINADKFNSSVRRKSERHKQD